MMTRTTIAVKITIIKNKTKTKNYESIVIAYSKQQMLMSIM